MVTYPIGTISEQLACRRNSSVDSYHLRIIFDQDVEASKVRALGFWITRDWKIHGLARPPEIFAQCDMLSPPGMPGSYSTPIRLFGRCPKYEFWSTVWDGSQWFDDEESIDWILNTSGDDPGLIPGKAIEHKKQLDLEREQNSKKIEEDEEYPEAKRVLDALSYCPNKDVAFDNWLNRGLEINSWDSSDAGLNIWIEWSKQSTKHVDGECERRWRSFTPGGARTIKSLFYLAINNGWKPAFRPKLPKIEVTTERHVVCDKAIKALAREERIFLRGDALATVARSPEATKKLFGGHILRNANGTHGVNLIDEPRLGCLLTENARLFQWHKNRQGKFESRDCHPPAWLVSAVLSHGEYPGFRPILTVAECPYIVSVR